MFTVPLNQTTSLGNKYEIKVKKLEDCFLILPHLAWDLSSYFQNWDQAYISTASFPHSSEAFFPNKPTLTTYMSFLTHVSSGNNRTHTTCGSSSQTKFHFKVIAGEFLEYFCLTSCPTDSEKLIWDKVWELGIF